MLVERMEKKAVDRKRNKLGVFESDESKMEVVECVYCAKKFKCYCHEKRKYCSHQCYGRSLKSKTFPNKRFVGHKEKNHFWNGGVTYQRGYKMILCREHPFSNMRGYVAEHRLVMEKHLGRFLDRSEVVHHLNKNVSDNRIENLKLFKNNKKHMEYHYATR